jgi:hypothetical protein
MAWGQATSAAPAAPSQKPTASGSPAAAAMPGPATPDASAPDPSKVPPDAPVITIQGLCDSPAADKSKMADCKTVMTRMQFEDLINAVQPKMAPFARKQFANRYAQSMVMADEAHKEGLDQGAKYDQLMKVVRMQVLSQLMNQSLQEKAGQISDKEIEDYYQANAANFQEASLQRIFVPRTKQTEPKDEAKADDSKDADNQAEEQKKQEASEANMKAEADKLRAQAVAGTDMDKLQQEAFDFGGLKTKPPATSMGKVRKNSLSPTQVSAMDLKPGEVSQVIADQSGFFIYKLIDKDTLPLDKVKAEITNTLRSQRLQQSMQAIQQSATTTLNDAYFVMPPGPPPPHMGMPPMGGNQPMKSAPKPN